jgi:RNA polymerase sigma factor for flagellar operon FliA
MYGAMAPADPDKLPGAWADPERLTNMAESRRILNRAIETLPIRYRHMLHLYYLEEWTMKQIGIRLGVDESRVSQIRAAALARLQAQLAPQFRNPE